MRYRTALMLGVAGSLALLALLSAVWLEPSPHSQGPTWITYSEFHDGLVNGRIAAVEIGDVRISGKFKNGTAFSTPTVPSDNSLMQLIKSNGVHYAIKAEKYGSPTPFIISLIIPPILILGSIIVILLIGQKSVNLKHHSSGLIRKGYYGFIPNCAVGDSHGGIPCRLKV